MQVKTGKNSSAKATLRKKHKSAEQAVKMPVA